MRKGIQKLRRRVLIVSGVVPALTRGGGCLALHRHFCERQDFAVAVASYTTAGTSCADVLQIPRTDWWLRVKRTRLCRLAENLDYLAAASRLPRALVRYAKDWKPDLIFSVADDIHAPIAHRLARTLRIPFAVNFQDLFACSSFVPRPCRPLPGVKSLLTSRYRKLQAQADAVFHTSDGMKEWFGMAARGDVLYPIGAATEIEPEPRPSPKGTLTLAYAGNCYGAYGAQVLSLARELDGAAKVTLQVFTMGNDWPAKDVQHYTRTGVYRGYLPFSALRDELEKADAFITTMSFAREDRVFVETSFTTKWLDYAPLGKPIVVWGPEYSSAARFARAKPTGLVVEDFKPASVIAAIERLRADHVEWTRLSLGAMDVAKNELNAERLHNLLKTRLLELVSVGMPPRRSPNRYLAV